eukprot:5090548-Pyramimonas_sp.AAC.1
MLRAAGRSDRGASEIARGSQVRGQGSEASNPHLDQGGGQWRTSRHAREAGRQTGKVQTRAAEGQKHTHELNHLEKQQPKVAEQIESDKQHPKELDNDNVEAEPNIKKVDGSALGRVGLDEAQSSGRSHRAPVQRAGQLQGRRGPPGVPRDPPARSRRCPGRERSTYGRGF